MSIDQHMQTAATDVFNNSGYLDLRNVTASCQAGTVKLGGLVPSYYSKQLAQELVRRLGDVEQVVNEIKVVTPAGRDLERGGDSHSANHGG